MDLFVEGLGFCEGPRWHEDRLWFSDFVSGRVASVSVRGDIRIEAEIDDWPSGLGWLPDGQLLVVSMRHRQLLRREHDGTMVVHADLASVATGDANDMVVAVDGTAYVGNLGSDLLAGEPRREARLALVRPDGAVEAAAGGLLIPNGSVITPDGSTLIVGESLGHRFSAFPIGRDGSLGQSWVWADLGERGPDGCTVDSDGAIWFAFPRGKVLVRVFEGGKIDEMIDVPDPPYACMLGGEDGRTLFVLTSSASPSRDMQAGSGRIWTIEVGAPHAGLP